MRCERCDHHEERGVGVVRGEAQGRVGDDVGRVVAGRVTVLANDTVFVEVVVEEVVRVVDEDAPFVPAAGDRRRDREVPVEVFAEQGGAISGCLEPGGEGRAVVEGAGRPGEGRRVRPTTRW